MGDQTQFRRPKLTTTTKINSRIYQNFDFCFDGGQRVKETPGWNDPLPSTSVDERQRETEPRGWGG